MSYSLGLTLYNLASRREEPLIVARPARPAGRLIWLHVPDPDAVQGMIELARRLMDEDGHAVLLTSPATPDLPAGLVWQPPPSDTPAQAHAFIDHWRPDVALLSEGELRPALLHEALTRQIPIAMVNGRAPWIGRKGWWPGLRRGLLGQFRHVLTLDQVSARAFRRAGAAADVVEPLGRLEEPSAALPCTEAERAALARLLGNRPVWLATDLPEAEENAVIEAHRSALRLAHRLLLILVPQDPARVDALTERMETAEGWTVARRAAEDEPESDVEVYIPDIAPEYGLWYRLAPVTFLGGSLSGPGCLRDPLEPAALGSAIIHGPRPGIYGGVFGRLGAARAARSVGTAGDLAEALGDLLAPDRAARLAQAAWGVASDGVDVTERALTLIRKMLGEG
ncbi:MAG: glycosyltransferase N-terminal domain-containing protein [Paracoccaceae bacterium]|nr:glycosyltransferase N-terminal domain-containing protein [Paracoccaceae bacterium]